LFVVSAEPGSIHRWALANPRHGQTLPRYVHMTSRLRESIHESRGGFARDGVTIKRRTSTHR